MTSPRTLDVDLLVIGWGKGGKTLAGAMAGAGKNVAIVEQSALMDGGTCINIGCVPTEALVQFASERREDDDPQAFFDAAVARRDTLIVKINDMNLHMLAGRETVTAVDGCARFIGPREVDVTPSAGAPGCSSN